jgi:hypothetical protein
MPIVKRRLLEVKCLVPIDEIADRYCGIHDPALAMKAETTRRPCLPAWTKTFLINEPRIFATWH